MALNEIIKENAAPVTIYRPGPDVTANGYRTSGPDAVIPTEAHIQPMSAKELRNVPEGQNTMEWYVGWSLSEIQVKDKVDIGPVIVTVQRTEYWPEGAYWKYQAVKVTD